MNSKRRALFGLSLAPMAIAPAAWGKTTKEVPARGSGPNSKWVVFVAGFQNDVGGGVPSYSFESARFVEVEIGGKREYVMTFKREK